MKIKENTMLYCGGVQSSLATVATLVRGKSVSGNKGFTLLELIAVLAIIAALVTIAIPTYNQMRNEARVARAASEIRSLELLISGYTLEKGSLPRLLTDVGPAADFKDPWGNSYVYRNIVDNGPVPPAPLPQTPLKERNTDQYNTDYDLYSTGVNGLSDPDCGEGYPQSNDDVVRTNDGGFVGLRF